MISRNHGDSDLLLGARQVTGEQTNTSVLLPNMVLPGAPDGVIIKVLRYPAPVPHPDVEVPTALRNIGFDAVPAVLGSTTADLPGLGLVTTSITSALVPDAADGFELACAYARRGESFTELAHQLGAVTAQLHQALAQAFPVCPMANPNHFVDGLRTRAQDAFAIGPQLAKYQAAINQKYDELAAKLANSKQDPQVQRIHGDLHLGQLLYQAASDNWFILDFEGEPLRPAAERALPDFPERDVAGMLRSFSYAAAVGNAEAPGWAEQAAASYLTGYQQHRGLNSQTLAALLLDKALYEAVYEARHRPDWLHIPVSAVEDILAGYQVS